ncbi:MAG TPA: glycosyltransferase family 39 protein [Thermoanaerobaculia bacterium]|nr:glycosyltransferase family 39 protein [Thermoanaerobaculia bacterium]
MSVPEWSGGPAGRRSTAGRNAPLIFWIVAVVCALSRFAARARSIWDWDEALFSLGMREYDVTNHHPHPPGFPVFIGMAKLVRLVADSDFRALQTISLIAGVFAFPAVFFLARELKFRFETSVVAGAVFAFFPNVLFFGGTAFSDVPSIVLVVWAAVFLLRGRESRNAYWLGTFLLALAIGMRPQNLLVGLLPGALATLRRRPVEVLVAVLIGIVVTGLAFGGAVYATGDLSAYVSTVRAHGDYIARIDSFRSPDRPPLWRLFLHFFTKQYQSGAMSIVATLFVIVSLAGAARTRDRPVLLTLLMFAPFAIFAWLILDRFSITRFSIGYQPMFALLVADGISRTVRQARVAEFVLGGAVVTAFAAWTLPALGPVRRHISPPVQAVDTVRQQFVPGRDTLFIGYSMTPFVEYDAPELSFIRVKDDRALPLTPVDRSFLLAEVTDRAPEGFLFQRRRGNLWNIARRHYFEVVFQPVTRTADFVSGWRAPYREGMDEFRWMGARSETHLPPASGDTVLRLQFDIPADLVETHPRVTIALNGKVVDQLQMTTDVAYPDYHVVPAPAGATNVLELSIDQTVLEEGENRGLRLRFLSWGAR